jgi:3-hydroxy acid dehydrogenase / malonic semialdehyde reductase
MPKTILVTGATSGFGKSIAEKFAEGGWNIIITGRRKDRLENIATDLQSRFNTAVLPLSFDVQERDQVFSSLQDLDQQWSSIDVLVNNAGLALGRDRFDVALLDDWNTMIDTNLKGLLYVSRAVLPYMKNQGKGHIINIGSTAGKEVYENGNVYCATKHAVDAISKAMRIDLLPLRIKVTAVHPGAAETEFSDIRFKGDKEKAKKVYENYTPLYSEDVAEIVWFCANQPEHVCINDLTVTCTAQANSFYLNNR